MPPDTGYFQERQIFFELGARQFSPSNWEVIYPQLVFITQAELCAT
jgi:hypothetical protein